MPHALTPMIKVDDPIAWGKLVKSWATGRSYFQPDAAAPPIPQTIAELKTQCQNVGVTIDIDPSIKGLAVMRYSEETMTLRLPPKALIERSEQLLADSDYPLADFYGTFFTVTGGPANKDQMMNFHHCRIGEYTVNSCQ